MLPDTGERYLTTPMFEGIAEDMDEEETQHLQVDARLSDAVPHPFVGDGVDLASVPIDRDGRRRNIA